MESDCFHYFRYHSSSISWCERQYEHNTHMIEYWNSLSSLIISFFGLLGLFTGNKNNILLYVNLIFIGFASFYFHATLSYFAQLLDELGITSILLLVIVKIYTPNQQNKQFTYMLRTFFLVQLFIQFYAPYYNRFILFLYAQPIINKLRHQSLNIQIVSYTLFTMSVICWIFDYLCTELSTTIEFHSVWHILIGITAYYLISKVN